MLKVRVTQQPLSTKRPEHWEALKNYLRRNKWHRGSEFCALTTDLQTYSDQTLGEASQVTKTPHHMGR
jgi:hypothetical protein